MKKRKSTAATQKDIYQQVTDFVVKELENGSIVWQQQWTSYGMPKNIVSGHRYRGWNLFWLNFLTLQKGYTTPFFITYKQAQELGGHVKQGEKGTPIIYLALIEDKRKTVILSDREGNEREAHPTFRVPKQFIVFNIDQTEGLSFDYKQRPELSEAQRMEVCEAVIAQMPKRPAITHRGTEAYYVPVTDTVTMPLFGMFHTEEAYYSTIFHELAHSTGHSSRLNRKELMEATRFGSETYSREELTAELTAAFLCAICGIEQQTILNSVAYIQGWLRALKNDKTLILKAATQAQAAADFILSRSEAAVSEPQQELTA